MDQYKHRWPIEASSGAGNGFSCLKIGQLTMSFLGPNHSVSRQCLGCMPDAVGISPPGKGRKCYLDQNLSELLFQYFSDFGLPKELAESSQVQTHVQVTKMHQTHQNSCLFTQELDSRLAIKNFIGHT